MLHWSNQKIPVPGRFAWLRTGRTWWCLVVSCGLAILARLLWVIIRNSSSPRCKEIGLASFYQAKVVKVVAFCLSQLHRDFGGMKISVFFLGAKLAQFFLWGDQPPRGDFHGIWSSREAAGWADKGPSVWSKEFQGNFRMVLLGLPGDDDWGLWDYFAGMFLVFFRFNLTDLHSQMMSLANDG